VIEIDVVVGDVYCNIQYSIVSMLPFISLNNYNYTFFVINPDPLTYSFQIFIIDPNTIKPFHLAATCL